jgi:2,3-bisphosphoglycerate-dependent phosphoglycerate mutase
MDDVVLVRHGESETAAAGLVGGDSALTARGREQARALAARSIDVCFTSPALRARETAALVLEGTAVPQTVLPELADIEFGEFTGKPLPKYRGWIAAHDPAEAPPGGESRVDTLRRFCGAYRVVLERPEARVLVVAHGLTLSALTDDPPQPAVAGVPYGSTLELTRAELESAVARLERWCEAPAW